MGSKQYFEERYGGGKPGKIDASLDAMLQSVEWGEYRIGDLFEKISTKKLKYKAKELPKRPIGEYNLPCLTSSFNNQGLNYYVPRHDSSILKNVITIPSNSDVYRAYFQSREFTVLSDAYAIRWIASKNILSYRQYLFMVMCINRVTDLPIYSYKNKLGGWNVVKKKFIQLPKKDGEIYFSLMDELIAELEAQRIAELEAQRIAELEAYLTAAGLKDCELTAEEEEALEKFSRNKVCLQEIYFKNIFNKVVQGRRLKKEDQQPGDIPFVMSGVSNNGVANYISNPIASFPKNSITIDIFGNTFYRDYDFGAGDDTGVYWNDEINYDKSAMLFYATAMSKAIAGKFSYGKKLRSSQSLEIKMMLPIKNGEVDMVFMQTFISGIQKLVIKDVVAYSDRKIAATKQAATV